MRFRALCFFLLLPMCLTAQEGQVLYLTDGRVIEGSYQTIKDDRIVWVMSGIGETSIPLNRVDYIDFPAPTVWKQLMEAFESGDLEKAIKGFRTVSNQKSKITYHPAPGNFANLAERRLLDCYRKTKEWGELRYIASKIEWDKLPAAEQAMKPMTQVWAKIGGEEWDEALTMADELGATSQGISTELGFARAIAYRGKGDEKGAVIALAEAFGPYPGKDRALAQEALIEAASILREDPERQPEMRALVHIYANLFGNGQLWKGAPKLAEDLLAQEYEVAGPSTTRGKDAPKGEGEVRARYVRVGRPINSGKLAIRIAEVKVMSGDYNIATKELGATAKMTPLAPNYPAEVAIDGKTGKEYAASKYDRAGEPAWLEIDLGSVKPVSSVIVWSPKNNGTVTKQLNNFDVELLDGSRKEVFAVRKLPNPNPKLEIPVSSKASE